MLTALVLQLIQCVVQLPETLTQDEKDEKNDQNVTNKVCITQINVIINHID